MSNEIHDILFYKISGSMLAEMYVLLIAVLNSFADNNGCDTGSKNALIFHLSYTCSCQY